MKSWIEKGKYSLIEKSKKITHDYNDWSWKTRDELFHLEDKFVFRFQLCQFHEMLEVYDRKQRLSQFAQIKFENASDTIYVRRIRYVREWILAAFEPFAKIVYLDLRSRYSKDSLMMKAVQIDDSDAALHNQGYLLIRTLQIFLQRATE